MGVFVTTTGEATTSPDIVVVPPLAPEAVVFDDVESSRVAGDDNDPTIVGATAETSLKAERELCVCV